MKSIALIVFLFSMITAPQSSFALICRSQIEVVGLKSILVDPSYYNRMQENQPPDIVAKSRGLIAATPKARSLLLASESREVLNFYLVINSATSSPLGQFSERALKSLISNIGSGLKVEVEPGYHFGTTLRRVKIIGSQQQIRKFMFSRFARSRVYSISVTSIASAHLINKLRDWIPAALQVSNESWE